MIDHPWAQPTELIKVDRAASSATCVFAAPAAHASTILDRKAWACEVFRRRAQPSSTCRSSAVSSSAPFGARSAHSECLDI
jgi:hypothetical protein